MTDQQRINEAAEKFTDALMQSYKTVAERGASAQERNTQLTEVFFIQTINYLRGQAEENRKVSEQLADQQQRQADAAQTLTRESVDAYMEFIDSMFSWWQEGIQTAEQGATETEKATKGEKDARRQATGRTPKGEISMADISQFVDKDYEQKEFNELAEAPVDAIQGVSKGDAEKLQQAFNVKTVRDLAENKFVRIAQAIVTLSGTR
jgi:hypothetical protein